MTARVQERTEFKPDGGVVVGDDGSAIAGEAVVAAAHEALRRGVTLHVLRAWMVASAVRPDDCPPGIVPSLLEFEAATQDAEEQRVLALVEQHLDVPPPEVVVVTVHQHAVKALLTASETADLIVLGTRGLGGFKHLMLGSVAEQVIRHASCSVLVARS